MQEKEIIITNLSSKVINPKPGATWKAFTVYMIQGNDGVTYETADRDFFNSLGIGKTTKITFKVETKSSNGRVYTSYKIDLPKKGEMNSSAIITRIDALEKTLLDALRQITKPVVAPLSSKKEEEPEQLSLFPDDDELSHIDEDDLGY